MTEREPGFYWIQLEPSEDWEPAMFTGEHWVLLGTAVHEDTPEEPAVVGKTIKVPEHPEDRRCSQCGTLEGEPHRYRHVARYE